MLPNNLISYTFPQNELGLEILKLYNSKIDKLTLFSHDPLSRIIINLIEFTPNRIIIYFIFKKAHDSIEVLFKIFINYSNKSNQNNFYQIEDCLELAANELQKNENKNLPFFNYIDIKKINHLIKINIDFIIEEGVIVFLRNFFTRNRNEDGSLTFKSLDVKLPKFQSLNLNFFEKLCHFMNKFFYDLQSKNKVFLQINFGNIHRKECSKFDFGVIALLGPNHSADLRKYQYANPYRKNFLINSNNRFSIIDAQNKTMYGYATF
jgi:hypothetical protein